MGTSYEGLSEQITNETHRMTQFIYGYMAVQFSEQNEFIKNMFS